MEQCIIPSIISGNTVKMSIRIDFFLICCKATYLSVCKNPDKDNASREKYKTNEFVFTAGAQLLFHIN
ncbi:MAG TPA: hypothetical protein DEQ30_10955 [Porphyromonadaceae bacterium]|nr:hypothetical protein [Porphyromonadaceae bacterium]